MHHRGHIELNHRPIALQVGFDKLPTHAHAGIIDQHIHLLAARFHLVVEPPRALALRQIGGNNSESCAA